MCIGVPMDWEVDNIMNLKKSFHSNFKQMYFYTKQRRLVYMYLFIHVE